MWAFRWIATMPSCRECGKQHVYMSCDHRIIVSPDRERLEQFLVDVPTFDGKIQPEPFDAALSDLPETVLFAEWWGE